ncbi:N-acetylmuramoyl-L-alanine amidase [Vagococcus acidifermentans]|uniref:SH3b domain-containing protein n=1 Tax=Vagococcus acidifermentans TaxID=564710 RepID=A0A430AT13_9ENTE|nr:N-acetylmuramoyl-L-alanine amidase [Vagococcus acidifermentans]RSU11190.1 hypothetical protein CBF27_08820 [Vagococcus acidifermentans]
MKEKRQTNRTFRLLLLTLGLIASVIAIFYVMSDDDVLTIKPLALNVRTKPGTEHPVIAQVHRNTNVIVLDEKNGWYHIELADKTSGWVAGWLAKDGLSGPVTELPAVITEDEVLLRENPADKGKKLTTLKKNDTVTVVLEKNGWARIIADNVFGWVPSHTLTPSEKGIPTPEKQTPLYVNTAELVVRTNPDLESRGFLTLKYGEQVAFAKKTKDWFEVTVADGRSGYVRPWAVSQSKLTEDSYYGIVPMAEYTVVLDAGHGGNDPGSETNNGTVVEKEVTLSTAQAVQAELVSYGFNVIMTRDTDTYIDLADIAAVSNQANADAFISFHFDSYDVPNAVSGTTTYYYHDRDIDLAHTINKFIKSTLPLENRGTEYADYQVLRDNRRPAVLLELGYMNSDYDASIIVKDSYQEKVAKAVRKGLIHYFNGG